jgi:GrpB-like predicted nucleotidyltransferase (UPF0157 family)
MTTGTNYSMLLLEKTWLKRTQALAKMMMSTAFFMCVFMATHSSVEQYLVSCDYMLTHPNDEKEYESLKTNLTQVS